VNIFKRLARHILKEELAQAAGGSVVTVEQQRAMARLEQENDDLKIDLFQSSQLIQHQEKRIKQMAPERQFLVVAVDGTVLEQEMVYSSDGKTRITVRLPLGHPWKQATELAQQLELANLSLDRVRDTIGSDTELRRKVLGLDQPADTEHHPV
jgi:hypothetical protein